MAVAINPPAWHVRDPAPTENEDLRSSRRHFMPLLLSFQASSLCSRPHQPRRLIAARIAPSMVAGCPRCRPVAGEKEVRPAGLRLRPTCILLRKRSKSGATLPDDVPGWQRLGQTESALPRLSRPLPRAPRGARPSIGPRRLWWPKTGWECEQPFRLLPLTMQVMVRHQRRLAFEMNVDDGAEGLLAQATPAGAAATSARRIDGIARTKADAVLAEIECPDCVVERARAGVADGGSGALRHGARDVRGQDRWKPGQGRPRATRSSAAGTTAARKRLAQDCACEKGPRSLGRFRVAQRQWSQTV